MNAAAASMSISPRHAGCAIRALSSDPNSITPPRRHQYSGLTPMRSPTSTSVAVSPSHAASRATWAADGQHHLGIGAAADAMAERRELCPHLAEIIALAVVGDDVAA